MAWYYFSPDKHGLETVGSVDWLRGEGCYEWEETTVLYHRETDTFYWETSGGCSCNGPLDYVESMSDLEHGKFHEVAKHITDTLTEKAQWDKDGAGELALEATRVIEACMRVREQKGE